MEKMHHRMGRFTAVGAVVAFVLGAAAPALGDTVYNTLDNSVDATAELMNLTLAGPTGSTTLKIQVDGKPDHPGCNINGTPHQLGLIATSSSPTVADTAWGGGDAIFNACNDTLTVIVTPHALGLTHVTFAEDAANTSTNGDPATTFSFAEATFDVHVTTGDGSGGGGTVCDADPAAPAWAAAMLQQSGYKPKSAGYKNYVSQVAQHMGPGATFEGFAKNSPHYADAVHDWMQTTFGITLASAASSARPGWECTPV